MADENGTSPDAGAPDIPGQPSGGAAPANQASAPPDAAGADPLDGSAVRRTANLQETAYILGITANTLSDKVRTDPHFPVLERGKHGTAYVFDVDQVVARGSSTYREGIVRPNRTSLKKAGRRGSQAASWCPSASAAARFCLKMSRRLR